MSQSTEHDQYMKEMAEHKQEEINALCNNGHHSWTHDYAGASCSRCNIDEEEWRKQGSH